jgi:predicted DNA-binding protein YlxM (UPF0122 family)
MIFFLSCLNSGRIDVAGIIYTKKRFNHKVVGVNHRLHIFFNYMQSTIDYCGLAAVASVNRLRKGICRSITNVCFVDLQENIRQYQFILNKTHSHASEDDQRIERLKESLKRIEKRLELLENAQVKKSVSHDKGSVKRKLTQKKNALLKQILFENKQLKGK